MCLVNFTVVFLDGIDAEPAHVVVSDFVDLSKTAFGYFSCNVPGVTEECFVNARHLCSILEERKSFKHLEAVVLPRFGEEHYIVRITSLLLKTAVISLSTL